MAEAGDAGYVRQASRIRHTVAGCAIQRTKRTPTRHGAWRDRSLRCAFSHDVAVMLARVRIGRSMLVEYGDFLCRAELEVGRAASGIEADAWLGTDGARGDGDGAADFDV